METYDQINEMKWNDNKTFGWHLVFSIKFLVTCLYNSGLSSLGVPGVPLHPQILADQLTLSQPGGQIMCTALLLAPPDFQTFLRPCN